MLVIHSCFNHSIQDNTVSLALFNRISGILKRTFSSGAHLHCFFFFLRLPGLLINLPNLFVIKNETGIHNLPSQLIFNVYNMENQESINQISERKSYVVSKIQDAVYHIMFPLFQSHKKKNFRFIQIPSTELTHIK